MSHMWHEGLDRLNWPYRTRRSNTLHGRPAPELQPPESTHGWPGVSGRRRSNQRRRLPVQWWTQHDWPPSPRTCTAKGHQLRVRRKHGHTQNTAVKMCSKISRYLFALNSYTTQKYLHLFHLYFLWPNTCQCILKKLGLGSSRVSTQQHVDVSTDFMLPSWRNDKEALRNMREKQLLLLNVSLLPGFLGSPPNSDRAKALLMSSWP